ncbi:hypothetical protein SB861_37860 [Paraburkholderia sp. SIMBA_049]
MSALPSIINHHPVLVAELLSSTETLMNNVREALLEARDDSDVGAIRTRAIRALNGVYSQIPSMTDEFVLLKLSALEEIERESIVGHMNAVIRSNKWRKALINRYFGEAA